ncbi:hypothetical protein PV05_02044 [Exophiala xenobiotica]|uniref:Uncharacterized protein n=1 Tax=Exophiala xenobiotica TaxID=348802 RepID=A0A0D2F232_9EURO|nr:uncharacterized protein PV05_02044 [Exophiala xenobiotica]KIW61988.1 hypothetical protein PV05_02044 [Exophiala xenobiotica]
MTRRKRTSSPSPSPSSAASQNQKRVAFEIPASLQHFSTISQSLATKPGSKPPTTSVQKTQSQPRPTSQSPSHPRSSLPATSSQNPKHSFIPQKRSFPDAQSWPQPVPKPQAYSATARLGGKPVNQSKASPPATMSQDRSVPKAPASPQRRSASNPGLPTLPAQEPALKPGEAPNLKTHPNLIASLVAQKRAENDAMGFRERWARKQAEYRMSKSPVNQLNHELHREAAGSNGRQIQSRSASNPLPARSAPAAPQAKHTAPVIIEVDTPSAETVSTPATEDSRTRKRKHPPKDQRPNEDDSLFGSPFSSPIAEFLERATDDAGLKDGAERNVTTSARSSMTGTPTLPPRDQRRQHTSQVSNHPDPSGNSSIPPLFSDKPFNNQPRSQSNQAVQSNMYDNSPTVMQQQLHPNSPMSMRSTTNQSVAYGPQPPIAPRSSLAPSHPYYARAQSVPGYYKIDMGQYYNNTAGPASSCPSPNVGPSQAYGKSPAPLSMTYPSYNLGGSPYMFSLPQAPGAIPTYGATMVTAAEQTKAQSSDPGLMTAADMVAGVNTKFRISTKDGFAVPKRF